MARFHQIHVRSGPAASQLLQSLPDQIRRASISDGCQSMTQHFSRIKQARERMIFQMFHGTYVLKHK